MSRNIPNFYKEYFLILLGRHIEKFKVSWDIANHGDCLHITCFGRFDGQKGDGAKAMQQICELADAYRIKLTLTADNKKLVDWYTQFGFEGKREDFSPMTREEAKKPVSIPWYHSTTQAFYRARELRAQ